MSNQSWVLCPICNNKTRTKIRGDTELINFPLFCPKCKQETLINVKQFNVSVIKEPDAKTQSRWFTVYETVITGLFYLRREPFMQKIEYIILNRLYYSAWIREWRLKINHNLRKNMAVSKEVSSCSFFIMIKHY